MQQHETKWSEPTNQRNARCAHKTTTTPHMLREQQKPHPLILENLYKYVMKRVAWRRRRRRRVERATGERRVHVEEVRVI
jgi:hypothetical protein